MTPDIILHIARDDYSRNIVETGDNAGFKASYGGTREFTAAMAEMGWQRGQGWCNYWANSVWWRAYSPSLPDELLPILRCALDELLQEKDSLGLWNTKRELAPLHYLGMKAITLEFYEESDAEMQQYLRSVFPGSLVMFSCSDDDDNEKGKEDHIGIGLLLGEYDGTMTCIEGNVGDAVRVTSRLLEDREVLGWIMPMQKLPVWNNYTLPTE